MTSFTRKLYAQDPAAAEAFHRQNRFNAARSAERAPLLTYTSRGYALTEFLPNGRLNPMIEEEHDASKSLERWMDRRFPR